MKRILLDNNNDLLFRNGTLALGHTTDQEAQLILGSNKGNWKEDPLLGADLVPLIRSKDGVSSIKQAAKTALARDGKKVSSIKFQDGLIEVEITE